VSTIERPLPPLNADERTTLESWLDFHPEVERNWFRRVLAAELAAPIYDPKADPNGPDGGFDLAEDATLSDALATWRAEIARAREHCAISGSASTAPPASSPPGKQR